MTLEYLAEVRVSSVSHTETADKSAIPARVEMSLRTTGYLALRNVHVSSIPSGVQLKGTVSTYHLKQLAQATALRVPGVREVRNELAVVSVR
jgi:osmotically-inducible protein OsmY